MNDSPSNMTRIEMFLAAVVTIGIFSIAIINGSFTLESFLVGGLIAFVFASASPIIFSIGRVVTILAVVLLMSVQILMLKIIGKQKSKSTT